MRVFIGIEFPREVKEYLEQLQQDIKIKCKSGNFTRKENFHLTLRFIGEAEAGLINELKRGIDDAVLQFECFNMELGRLGQFARGNKHIIWVGIKPNKNLNALHSRLEASLEAIGFPKDQKGYTPHVTLAREAVLKEDLNNILQLVKVSNMTIPIHKITLFESTRANGVLTYRPVYAKELHNQ